MTRQIIQLLLENQGFISAESLSNILKQSLSVVNREILRLMEQYPDLLIVRDNEDGINAHFYVKIAPYGEDIARSLLYL